MKFIFLFFLVSCGQDYGIVTEKVYEEVIEYEDVGPIWIDSFLQVGETDEIDIVWSIDRSGSMFNNDEKLILGIESMINALPPDRSWRIGVISTDEDEAMSNTIFPLVPGDSLADAEDRVNELTSGQAIYVAGEEGFNAIRSYMEYGNYASTWMRPGASLLTVFVSDEDDQSNWDPAEFITWYKMKRINSHIASIVVTEKSECETLMATGYNYIDATTIHSGEIVDICEEDWSTGVNAAIDRLQPIEELGLSQYPAPDTIRVFINGYLWNDWTYDAFSNVLSFTTIPSAGDFVEVAYNVAM